MFILISILMAFPQTIFLLIWFHKNAFVEYASLLGLEKLFKVDEYKEVSADDTELTYPKFLLNYYNSFIVRMIGCPICFGAWISCLQNVVLYAIVCNLYQDWGLLLMLVPSISMTLYVSLYLYYKLISIMK
ncbi:membrane hypothetical protein [Gammaproteobacteria bacterium]